MKKITSVLVRTIVLIIIPGFIGISTLSAQTWTSIDGGGTNGISSTTDVNSNYPSVAVFNGELYAIWQENFAGVDQIHIKKYNGSTWSPVGNTAGQSLLNTNASNAWSPKIVTCNGALYAAWYEYGDDITRIRVKKYNGSSWTFAENYAVGDGRTNINNLPVALAIKVDMIVFNNELYTTWVETEPSGSGIQQIRVAKFNGSVWSSIDGGTFWGINYDKAKNATNSTLCVFNNKLYAAWTESDASSILQLRVKRYDGGSVWTFVDGNGSTGLNYSTTTTLFDGPLSLSSYNGKMYAFWTESNRIRAKQYDETNGWVADPADGGTGIGWCHTSTNVAYYPAIYSYDRLYVTWEQNPVPRQVRVASYDGVTRTFIDGNAVAIGINNTIANRAHFPKLIEYNGDLAAVWSEELTSTSGSANQIRAKTYPLPPIVKSVAVPANATYITGQALNFTVTFSKDVVVSGGTPYIPITLNTGGTVNAIYTSGSGTSTLTFRYTIVSGNGDADGISVGTAVSNGGSTIQSEDAIPLTANLTLNSMGSTTGILVDGIASTITSGTLASGNSYIDVTFSEGIYGANDGTTPLSAGKLSLTYTRNGGMATNAVISSVRKNDNVVEGSASALTGGETIVRVFLTITGTSSGVETIEIKPANGTSIYDHAGNAMSVSQTTGVKNLNDNTTPTLVSASRTNNTELIVTLSENCTNTTKGNNGGFTVCETGAPATTYAVSAIAQGVDASHVVLTVANMGVSGLEGVTVKYTAGGNGTIQDINGNAMATNITGIPAGAWDVTAPTITSGTLALNNAYIDISFSEGVYGAVNGSTLLTADKLSLTFTRNGGTATNTVISSVKKNDNTVEGSASALTGGETTIRVFLSVTGTPNGVETIEIKPANGNTVYDQAGNATLTTQTTGVKNLNDNIAPTVIISTSATEPTDASSIPVTITFSESVIGFDSEDIIVTNGTKGTLSGSGDTYNINITPTSQGLVTVNVAADIAHDAAGNTNTAATQLSRTFDNAAPTTTISSTTSEPTNTSPIPVTITFNVSVTGFTADEIVVTNGTKSILSGGPAVYTIDVTPSGQGAITVNVAAGTATDAAGNANTAAIQLSRTFDNMVPSVTVSSTILDPTRSNQISVNIDFSEEVVGFDITDVALGNATASNLQTSDQKNWTVDVSPIGTGAFTVGVAAGAAKDAAGNNNTASNYFQRTYDPVSPIVVLTSDSPDPTNDNPIVVNIALSESSWDLLDISDIIVGNGTASNLQLLGTGYHQYWTVDIYPATDGLVTVDIPAGAVKDYAGNNNVAATQFSITCNNSDPTVTISSTASEFTNTSPIPVNITFSKPVSDFAAEDITVSNGSKGLLSGSGASYTINITPDGQGVVTVDIAAGVAHDAMGNANTAAIQLSRTFDNIVPSVTVSSTILDPTRSNQISVNIDFSEEVVGFDITDIALGNATASNLQTSDQKNWTVDVSPIGTGGFSVGVAAGAAKDAAGNNNTASSYFQRTYDPVSPIIVLTSVNPDPTNDNPIVINIALSESSWGLLDISDIIVGNGTASNLQLLGTGYHQYWTVDIYPATDGLVTVDIPAGAVQDYAGNNNIAATQFSITCDITAPTVILSSSASEYTNTSPIPVTITFNEPVTGFMEGDITITNGTAGNFNGSGTTYTVDITPSGQGVVAVNVAAGVAQDALGNNNIAATPLSRTFDNIPPTVLSVSSSANDGVYKTGDVITITTTFSEVVIVNGIPTLALNSGGTAAYVSGSGSSILSFSYTVADNNSCADLDYLTTSALSLSEGTIKDVAENSAILTLPEVGSSNSLSGQKDILIGIIPEVTTQSVSDILTITATGNGSITDLGYPNPVAYGVCWNMTGTPTLSDEKANNGAASSTGSFTASLTELASGKTFYVRAYVTNAAGTSYGDEVSFTTNGIITYVLNGGTNHEANADTYVYGTGLALSDPTRTGYIFGGWYDNETFTGTTITSISSTTKGNVTLYAKWNSATAIDMVTGTDISIYPNPAKDEIFVKGARKGIIYVYDINSRLIMTKQMDDNGNLDISSWAPGVYLVKINHMNLKLIKQ